jgi:hypothetical protein
MSPRPRTKPTHRANHRGHALCGRICWGPMNVTNDPALVTCTRCIAIQKRTSVIQ